MPVLLSLRLSTRDAGSTLSSEYAVHNLLWRALKARLGRKGRQLELVRPTGFILGVEVIERLRNLHGIHHYLRVLLGARQGAGSWRVDEAVDHDVGHVYAMLGVFLRQHLRERAHHH